MMKKFNKLLAGLTAFTMFISFMPVISLATTTDYVAVNTDSANGWGAYGGTSALDTDNYVEGSGSIKVLMPAIDNAAPAMPAIAEL